MKRTESLLYFAIRDTLRTLDRRLTVHARAQIARAVLRAGLAARASDGRAYLIDPSTHRAWPLETHV